jgi:hypothetical protein
MRIAATISYTQNWQEIADIVIPVFSEYCSRQRYSLFTTIDEYDRYSGQFKLYNIKNLLPYYDIVFSFDCDVLITNFNIKLETFIEDGADFFVCEGMNMGTFGLRKSPFGIKLLNYMIDEIEAGRCHCEQDAIEKVAKYDPNIKIHQHPAFNSYLPELYGHIPEPEKVTEKEGRWMPGQFCLHLPALSIEQRIKLLTEYKEKIIR